MRVRAALCGFLAVVALGCGSGSSTSPQAGISGEWKGQITSGVTPTTYTLDVTFVPSGGTYGGFANVSPSLTGSGSSTAYLDVIAVPTNADSLTIAISSGGPAIFFQGRQTAQTTIQGVLSGALTGFVALQKQ